MSAQSGECVLRLPNPQVIKCVVARWCRDLSGRGLSGFIPTDSSVWGDLTDLTRLDLSNNDLSGRVPTGIARSPKLKYMCASAHTEVYSQDSSRHAWQAIDFSCKFTKRNSLLG